MPHKASLIVILILVPSTIDLQCNYNYFITCPTISVLLHRGHLIHSCTFSPNGVICLTVTHCSQSNHFSWMPLLPLYSWQPIAGPLGDYFFSLAKLTLFWSLHWQNPEPMPHCATKVAGALWCKKVAIIAYNCPIWIFGGIAIQYLLLCQWGSNVHWLGWTCPKPLLLHATPEFFDDCWGARLACCRSGGGPWGIYLVCNYVKLMQKFTH